MRPSHLARYKDIGTLLVKHRHLVMDRDDGCRPWPPTARPDPAMVADAEALASDLEEMGPTFIKLGQLLSTRSDLLPPPYLHALARLQDRVEPFGFDVVEETVDRRARSAHLEGLPRPSTIGRWPPPRWARCTVPSSATAAGWP